jgi:hypothetical protein
MRPRNQTSAPPVAVPKPAPIPAPGPAQPQTAPGPGPGPTVAAQPAPKQAPWDPGFISVAILNRAAEGLQARGDGEQGLAEDVDTPIPPGGFAEVVGAPLCAFRQPDIRLIAHVDDGETARPLPYTLSRVHATVRFQPAGKTNATTVLDATSIGSYIDPGFPLGTSFPWKVPFTPPGAGTLYVSIAHSDPDSGGLAVLSDAIPVVECPGVEKLGFADSAVQTGVWLNVPDPVNAPLEVRRLDKHENWRSDAETVELWHDERGYYYISLIGNKVRLPGRPD